MCILYMCAAIGVIINDDDDDDYILRNALHCIGETKIQKVVLLARSCQQQ